MFGKTFVFEDNDALYNKVFPKNTPTNVEFEAEVVIDPASQNYLGTFNLHLSALSDYASNPREDNRNGGWLVGKLINLSEALNLRMINEVSEGDLVFGGKRTAINIYASDEFVSIAKAIYDSFMFYTGNDKIAGLKLPMGRSANDSLIEYFLKIKDYPDVIQVLKPLAG